MNAKILFLTRCAVLVVSAMTFGGSLQAPSGLFKDLNDAIRGDAVILNGKQLFLDDFIIEELKGTEKVLNQPTKHPSNPLLVPDKPWEVNGHCNTTVMYDEAEEIFKMWYGMWISEANPGTEMLGYATSKDGILWTKPIMNKKDKTI